MALDDFTTAAEEDEVTGASNIFSEREALDEDLFDFPPVAFGDPVNDADINDPAAPLPNEEAKDDATEEVSSTPMAEVDAPEVVADAEPKISAPESESISPDAAPTATSGDPDEDLFEFGQLFSPADLAASSEHIAKADLFEETVPAAEPEASPEAEAASVDSGSVTYAGTESEVAAPLPIQPVILAAPASPIRTRVLFGLIGSVLLLNAVLILMAWQASRAFQSTLEGVRADMLTNGGQTQPTVIQAPTIAQNRTQNPDLQVAVPLDDYEAQELSIARSELEVGKFSTARVRLFSLLANRDRLNVTEDAIADAEYLIAESYIQQAKSLPGGEE